MNKSESIVALAAALAQAQGEIENATKDSINPHFKSKYADLAEVLNTIRPVFSKNGLAVTQLPAYESGIVSVETVLMHKSGEWMSGVASSRVSKDDAQGVGSCITYLRRYSLAAFAGIAQEDDDGNTATQRAQHQNHKQKLPALADDRFKNALEKVSTGEFPADRLESEYALTAEQKKQLAAIVGGE